MKKIEYSDFKSIRYMGSKKRLMEFIHSSFNEYKQEFVDFNIKSFADIFSGSGSVAFYFRHQYKIITNDKLAFNQVIMNAYLRNEQKPSFYKFYIKELNNININDFETWKEQGKIDGWITQNYGGAFNNGLNVDENGNRKIWILSNAKKIEMILAKINEYQLTEIEKNVLTLSLLLAIDKISNCLGHQNGYLKEWAKIALNPIKLEYPNIEKWDNPKHETICLNAIENNLPYADLAYIDPPYGSNNSNLSVSTRYASFYHIWDTLITSKPFHRPETFGKAGKPTINKGFSENLEINKKEIVIPEIIKLINKTNSTFVALSYSNKGLLNIHDIEQIFKSANCDMNYFRIFTSVHKNNSQKHTAKKNGKFIDRKNDKADLIEYLFIAKKQYCSTTQIEINNQPSNDIIRQGVLNNNVKKGKTMKNYIGYCRVSTKYQEKSGLGLLAQQDSINNFIKLRNGNLIQEFNEIESGKENNRPKLKEAMEACRLYDATLLIAKIDRLSRDASFLLSLQKGDVPFIAVDMPDANNFTIGIMALLAQQEREMISKRTKEALAILKAKGKKLGGKRENSHKITKEDIEKGRLVKVEKYKLYKDRITPTLKELKDNGLTLKEICKTLEERKIKTFRKKNIWTIVALRNLLKA